MPKLSATYVRLWYNIYGVIIVDMKACSKCKENLPINCFSIWGVAKDGLKGQCKKCAKQFYSDHREHILGQKKQYANANGKQIAKRMKQYVVINREHIAEQRKQWREDHKEQIAELNKKYREAHRDQIAERNKQWRDNNPDKIKLLNQRRRSMKACLPAALTNEEWNAAKEYFNNCCAYCGKEKQLTQDHFYPLNKGGEYSKENIVPACKNCNSSKRDKLFKDFYPNFKHYSEQRERKILGYLRYKRGNQQLVLAY